MRAVYSTKPSCKSAHQLGSGGGQGQGHRGKSLVIEATRGDGNTLWLDTEMADNILAGMFGDGDNVITTTHPNWHHILIK